MQSYFSPDQWHIVAPKLKPFPPPIPDPIAPTSSMALAQVVEAPHVPQAHAEPHTRQHVLGLAVPFGPVSHLLRLQLRKLFMGQDPVFQTRVRQLELHGAPWFLSLTQREQLSGRGRVRVCAWELK